MSVGQKYPQWSPGIFKYKPSVSLSYWRRCLLPALFSLQGKDFAYDEFDPFESQYLVMTGNYDNISAFHLI